MMEERLSKAPSPPQVPSESESMESTMESFIGEGIGEDEWWDVYHPYYGFKDPRIRSRLERLMGSNIVRILDRKYMTKLQEKLKEDHLQNQMKRIQEREADEVEREKKLILEGKIPIEDAPKELKNHPVCKINQITKKILEEKKSKLKVHSKISAYKTPLKKVNRAKSKESVVSERSRSGSEREDDDVEKEEEVDDLITEVTEKESSDDVSIGLMFGKEEYEKLKYEDPLVKIMREAGSVEQMYKLAERIVGPLKHIKSQINEGDENDEMID